MDFILKLLNMKKAFLFIVLIFTGLSSNSQTNSNIYYEKIANERLKLKNYAFCECLQEVYKGDSLFIKDGSTEGYFQTGAYNTNAYETIDSIAKIFSEKKYNSKENHTLGLMKCLDFYNSNELNKLINDLDHELDQGKLNE
jgi:hypothetical protein